MKKIFGPETPYVGKLDQLTALMLVNSNPAVDYPDSLPPNIIQVGGLQIKDPKPVPEEFEAFLSNGKKGSVLMALGTNIRSDEIGEDKIKMVIEAFRQTPDYNFLWKFETTEMLKNLPPNVKISAWLPQNDILALPTTKLFISHGGLLSSHEASWWGVPVVGIPFLADQHRNLHKLVTIKGAAKVEFKTMTTEKLKTAIDEVLGNPKYRKNMQIRSQRFRDQPEKPLERAVWWCEYVLRNPKPAHLRPAECNIGLLGSHFWDIQVLILFLLFAIVLCIKGVVKKIFRPRSKINDAKKKN